MPFPSSQLGMAGGGGDWWVYDEALRSLRQQRGWAWDSMKWELWMNASQSPARTVFQGQGPPNFSQSVSSTTGGGGSCRGDTCCFTHKCRHCNGLHPLFHCRAPEKRYNSSSPPSVQSSRRTGLRIDGLFSPRIMDKVATFRPGQRMWRRWSLHLCSRLVSTRLCMQH